MLKLRDFIGELGPSDKEMFDSIISDITEEGSEIEITKLSLDLNKIKKNIDKINTDRQRVSQIAKKCDKFINMIDSHLKDNADADNIELHCLKILLSSWLKDSKDYILHTKPIGLLEDKFNLKKNIDNRINRNNLITTLLLRMKDGTA